VGSVPTDVDRPSLTAGFWRGFAYVPESPPELRAIPTIVITAVPKEQVRVITNAVFPKPLDFVKLTRAIDALITR
jgi:hypothetical protein